MKPSVRIAISGDFNPDNAGHLAANEALQHSADALGIDIIGDWLPTAGTASEAGAACLERYDGVFSAGGSYESKPGAIAAIRFAREQGWPFFGT
jgi:CTP synthase (UTP-ammonia lyase)